MKGEKMTKRNCLLVTLLVGAAFWAGCKTVYTGPEMETKAVYSWGTLKTTENKPIAIVNAAALKAVDELGLTVTMKTVDSLAAQIIARDSQDRKISINLTSLADNSTDIVIKVGTIGDEDKSRIIYKHIQANPKK